MKRRYFLPSVAIAGLILIFACGETKAARAALTGNSASEVQMLREAYHALAVADHDYHGHRIKAMKQIEEASKAMGAPIRGEGKGHEPQGESDAQLRKAQSLLQGISSTSSKHGHRHIERALSELSIALSIK